MKIYDIIKTDRMDAMRSKNTVKKLFLDTLVGEIELVAKGNPIDDELTLKVLKKFKKSAEEVAKASPEHSEDVKAEIVYINNFLPSELSYEELEIVIEKTFGDEIRKVERKGQIIGKVIAGLKGENVAFDSSHVAKIVNNIK